MGQSMAAVCFSVDISQWRLNVLIPPKVRHLPPSSLTEGQPARSGPHRDDDLATSFFTKCRSEVLKDRSPTTHAAKNEKIRFVHHAAMRYQMTIHSLCRNGVPNNNTLTMPQ